jgi:hypothetical protein
MLYGYKNYPMMVFKLEPVSEPTREIAGTQIAEDHPKSF